MYTRITGALFYAGGCYAVYNTRDAVMKWSGQGEIKASGNLLELARMNAGLSEISAALLLGKDADFTAGKPSHKHAISTAYSGINRDCVRRAIF